MRRVSVVGNSGSGKSTLGRKLAARLDVPYVELDAIHHLADWTPIDADDFMAEAARLAATDGWVVDGNYRDVVVEGPIWERADTVVWLALPRTQVMRQVLARTCRRLVKRQVLWNGNREPLKNFVFWKEPSIFNWAWTQHAKYEQRFTAAAADPACEHLRFIKFTSHAEADAWLAGLVGESD